MIFFVFQLIGRFGIVAGRGGQLLQNFPGVGGEKNIERRDRPPKHSPYCDPDEPGRRRPPSCVDA